MLTLGQHTRLKNSFFPYRYKTFTRVLPKNDADDIVIIYENKTGCKLRKSGRALVGKCPFHADDKPSFAIYQETKSAYCFGCNWVGNFNWLVKCLRDV